MSLKCRAWLPFYITGGRERERESALVNLPSPKVTTVYCTAHLLKDLVYPAIFCRLRLCNRDSGQHGLFCVLQTDRNKRATEWKSTVNDTSRSWGKNAALPHLTRHCAERWWWSTAVFVMREQIFCTITSCGCVFATRRFEGTYRRPLQDYESYGLITLKRKAVRSLKRPGRNYPKTTAQQHPRPVSSSVTQWKPQIAFFILLKMYIISKYFNIIVYYVVFMHERLER